MALQGAARPTLAFLTTLTGSIMIIAYSMVTMVRPSTPIQAIVSVLGVAPGLIALTGSYLIYSGKARRVRAGGALAIVFGGLSIVTGGGLLVGLALCIVGGVLALIWRPPSEMELG